MISPTLQQKEAMERPSAWARDEDLEEGSAAARPQSGEYMRHKGKQQYHATSACTTHVHLLP